MNERWMKIEDADYVFLLLFMRRWKNLKTRNKKLEKQKQEIKFENNAKQFH